ncbi:MAG: indolepyruvate ferredoxin oxidoreductase subunit alpha, partial [Paraburkholderia tropica]
RACHVHGQFVASDNRRPAFTIKDALEHPSRDVDRIVLPPASFLHEREKIHERWPAAVKFIEERRLNEFFADDKRDWHDIGLAVQGGSYNTVLRALERLGLADVYGDSAIPLYVMNVAYPLIDSEWERFCAGKRAVLVIEEGQPNFVEQNASAILRQRGVNATLHGKDMLPLAGEYNAATVVKGLRAFFERYGVLQAQPEQAAPRKVIPVQAVATAAAESPVQPTLDDSVHARPPGFCTGCPERPIFTAMKLVERELGPHHVSADIGCHLFSILPPFNLGATTMGYGLGSASAAALNAPASKRAISVMGDGGFWHNGLTSGIANAVFNKSDNLTIVVDNSYTSATGGQDILSSTALNPTRSTGHEIEQAVRGVGVKWVRTVRRTYDLKTMMATLRDGLTTGAKGPKVLIAQSECMLNKQRREKPKQRKAIAAGERVVRERFGVDSDTCTGDHSCIRLSGCPSLSIKPNPDPLRTDPVASVLDSCVGCGLCGEVSHAAVLCPSFYRAQIISNPTKVDRLRQRLRNAVIGWLQRREAQRRARYAF